MKVEDAVDIEAPPEAVWAVTVDVERWPEWTPTMKSARRVDQGPFAAGSAALIRQPGLPEARWVVTTFKPGENFTWETRVRGVRIVATHELTGIPTGTRNLLRVEVFGLLAGFLWPLIRSSLRRALEQENAGLKNRCEASGS